MFATNGTDEARVRIWHWWPTKPFCNGMPAYLVNEARRMGSRYLSLAVADLPEGCISATVFAVPMTRHRGSWDGQLRWGGWRKCWMSWAGN